jgi:hypothetical protein
MRAAVHVSGNGHRDVRPRQPLQAVTVPHAHWYPSTAFIEVFLEAEHPGSNMPRPINPATAKSLGLTFPMSLLAEANEVIE